MRRNGASTLAACVAVAALSACTGGLMSGQRTPAPAPVVNPATTSSTVLAGYLELLQKLVGGPPTEQAEIVTNAQHDFDAAPTPSHQLRLALILGTTRHPATDLPRAQTLLRELMANPEMLLPAERSLAFLKLSQIDDYLTLEAENRRLQSEAARADRARTAAADHRLQAELDENARLKKELDEARAKLAAIANIERSLNERKPGATGH
jgi:hypothetical protein